MSDDREAILARRRRFIAWALAGGTVVHATACVCLDPAYDAAQLEADSGADGTDGAPSEEERDGE